jgi:predicted ATPase
MFAGRFALSRSHLEESLALYDPISSRSLVRQVGLDIHATSQTRLAIVLFCLGFPDQALAGSDSAIAEARRLAHLPTLADTLVGATRLLSLIGDDAALDERAEELAAVATEQSYPYWIAAGRIFRGWLRVKSGDAIEGVALLRDGIEAYRASGQQAWMPHYIALLAKAYQITGQIEDALTLLDKASQIIERTGERWFEAELYRHKGELLLWQGHAGAAEEHYRKASSIAQEQEAKLWELRATTSLAQLRRDQGRRTEAYELLAPIYGWFTEGFDTSDLKEAKSLLEAIEA